MITKTEKGCKQEEREEEKKRQEAKKEPAFALHAR
jgi:hypothetical protein